MQFDRAFFEMAEKKYRRDCRKFCVVAAAFSALAGVVAATGGLAWLYVLIPVVFCGAIATAALHDAEEMADCVRRWDEGER